MKNIKAKAVCAVLTASLAAMGLTGCGSENVDGTKTAITVNDESITLGEANFMLRYQQASMYNYYSQLYSMYGAQMPTTMYDQEGEDGKTTGETFKEQALETIEKELLMRQHAEEYGISLTDEEKAQAKEAAQAFADKNGDKVMEKLHATVDDIQDALELYVIQSRIYDPIIADVDTNVSDAEAQQTSISYIKVSTKGTETDSNGKTIDLTDDEKAAKKEIAQRFLDLLKKSEDPANASFTDLRQELNDQLNAENTANTSDDTKKEDSSASTDSTSTSSASSASSTSSTSTSSSSSSDSSSSEISYLTSSETSFGTGAEKDDDDTCSLGDAVAEAVTGLADGAYYDGVIEGDDGYYVVRVDKAFDEDKTESRRQTIISDRKSNRYNEVLDGWVKESDIKVESNWKKLEVTDADMYTMTVDSSSDTAADSTTTDGTTSQSTVSSSSAADSTSTSTESTSTSSVSASSAE